MDTREVVNAIEGIIKEKKIERSKLSEIVKSIFLSILKKKFNLDEEENAEDYFSVTFNIDTGDVEIMHDREVVADEDFDNPVSQIKLTDALAIDPDAEAGDDLPEIIDFNSFGRRHIIAAKQILAQKIKKVERANTYDTYIEKIGEIIMGSIHQITPREIKINYDDIEVIMPKSESVFNERYRRGELLKAVIKDVYFKNQDVKVIVSRSDSDFIKKLFETEVPEISDGIIEIIQVARRPGIRSKVILETLDSRVDPVGACVGQRGARITAIVSELNKEKIDIIQKINEPKMFITRLLGIKTEYQLDLDVENKTAEAIVPDHIYDDVMGLRNSNVELTEEVSGYKLKVMTESEYEEMTNLTIEKVEEFTDELKALLAANGIKDAETFYETEKDVILQMEGMDESKYNYIKATLDSYYSE
ncbi:MAG: transcription termination factor NusA [Candidatus Delongbacteria bacterium]|jgi:N utilization substance protein A|nr:transcription termination factor NusA [Candidatus Delongbacteria bacterium]MDD4205449.1 transcription termination factor NusA [Candidatus Delongbacteria bacterium]MDY0017063.1 transcription termination factor NusA [Candidatus Delongbacteria bacterium]